MDYSNKKFNDKFDFIIFGCAILLIGIGLIAIYSATHEHPTAYGNFNRQLISFLISIILFLIAYLIPYKIYRFIAIPSYIFSIILLIAVLFLGKTVYGAKSWISIGSFGFQPSEFAKIGLILFLSYFLTRQRRNPNNLTDFILLLVISLVPVTLILMEPDLGTAIVFILISSVITFWSGFDLFKIFVVLSPGVVVFASLFGIPAFLIAFIIVIALLFYFKRNLFINASIVVINFAAVFLFGYVKSFLKPHQQKRIETFINPMSDPLGAGYNILQTKVAIGSGGLFGKGFLEGNQTQLRFIPEQWTDFIYCVIGEEFGFIGSLLVVLLFTTILIRLVYIATQSRDKFGSTIIIGTFTLFFVHFSINIGMNLGIAPVIGLPLPFMSYGGSSLMVNMTLLGIVMNFYKNRREHI